MRPRILCGILLLTLSTGVNAQTIEQRYADQCASSEQAEACAVLRRELIEKLRALGDSSMGEVPSPYSASDWGRFAAFAGKTWIVYDSGVQDAFYIQRVVFERGDLVIYNTLYAEHQAEFPSTTRISRKSNGTLVAAGAKDYAVVQPNGDIHWFASKRQKKPVGVITLVRGQMISYRADDPKRVYTYTQVTDVEVPELVAAWRERRRNADQQRRAARSAFWNDVANVAMGMAAVLPSIIAQQDQTSRSGMPGLASGPVGSAGTVSVDPEPAGPSDLVRPDTSVGAPSPTGVATGSRRPPEMCQYPSIQTVIFDRAEEIPGQIATACGRASPSELRRECDDNLGWCKVWVQCSAWEAPCPGGASTQ